MEPSGVRLMRLITTQSLEIAQRELRNGNKMCLYGTGDYWTCFEHSAYFMSRIFPDLKSFVVTHPDYPYSIVGLSVSENQLRQYMKTHTAHHKSEDYLEFEMDTFPTDDFPGWQAEKENSLKEMQPA